MECIKLQIKSNDYKCKNGASYVHSRKLFSLNVGTLSDLSICTKDVNTLNLNTNAPIYTNFDQTVSK